MVDGTHSLEKQIQTRVRMLEWSVRVAQIDTPGTENVLHRAVDRLMVFKRLFINVENWPRRTPPVFSSPFS